MNIKALYRLTKPGVTYGNLITTIAGYLFAANGSINWTVFAALTAGTWAVIASACVINNYLDQDIDALMERTKNRPLLANEATGRQAVIFGLALGILGTFVLALWTNWWVVGVGLGGWIVYVWLYGALGKRKSVHGTLVGSISGAAPILAGYVAVSNGLDGAAALLFLILFFWQMPEFYSISIFRQKEYAAAGVPVNSVVKGIDNTKRQILAYTILFVGSTLMLNVYSHAGWIYFILMLGLGAYWINLGIEGVISTDNLAWARKMFRFSLVILVAFSFIISVNNFLP